LQVRVLLGAQIKIPKMGILFVLPVWREPAPRLIVPPAGGNPLAFENYLRVLLGAQIKIPQMGIFRSANCHTLSTIISFYGF